MFVYSPKPLLTKEFGHTSDGTVAQVDLVPTLATVLGVPIPFSNLGTLVVEALPSSGSGGDDWKYGFDALCNNVQQVHNYILKYSETSGQLPQITLNEIERIYEDIKLQMRNVNTAEDFKLFLVAAQKYMLKIKEMCNEVWIKFDSSSMSWGLIFMCLAVLSAFVLIEGISRTKLLKIVTGKLLSFVYLSMLLIIAVNFTLYRSDMIDNYETPSYFFTNVVSLFILTIIFLQNFREIMRHIRERVGQDWYSIAVRTLLFFSACGVFSNSYVVEESSVLSYFLTTATVLLIFSVKPERDLFKNKHKWWSVQTAPRKLKVLFLVVLFNILLRISHYYWRCREEQAWCDSPITPKSSFSSVQGRYGNMRYCVTLISLALFVTVCRMWLRSCGNLVGFSVTVTLTRYMPTVIVVCTCVFWALLGLPKNMKSHLEAWHQQLVAWIIYGLVSLSTCSVFIDPLCVFVVPKQKEDMTIYYGQENIIPHLFNQLKESMYKQSKSSDDRAQMQYPVVYGLATTYSSALFIVNVMFVLLMTLLLGDVLAPSAVLMFVSSVVLASILAVSRLESNTGIGK